VTPERFQLIESIFDEASALAGAEREAFLDERCAGDGEVRRMVVRLLEEDEREDGLFEAPRGVPLSEDLETLLGGPSPPIPERIGRYRVLREHARGGMGTVYEAEQDVPKRRVALKLIRAGVVSRGVTRRFRQEAEILGRLQHPGIAQVHDAGTFDAGSGIQPYLAMEFVDGPTLREHVERAGMDVRGRLELVARVCDAVHYAHLKGVIHRDLKPENVLVQGGSRHDDDSGSGCADAIGQPKILDFGVARLTDEDVRVTTMRTSVGQLIGTVQYMSPEQAAGDSRVLDIRSDIYALGVMLFELLAGRPPYDLSNRSIPDAVMVIRERNPSRLGSVDSSFRGDVETIVGKALEKEPARRYQSASDLAADIRRYLRHEPITARSPSVWYQVRKFARRNRTLVAGVVATFVVLVAGVVVSASLAVRADHNARLARLNEASSTRESYRASLAAAGALLRDDPVEAAHYLDAAPEELRGWEWRYLNAQLDRHVMSYAGPLGVDPIFAFSPDGSRLLASLDGRGIGVWDVERTGMARTIPTDGPVTGMAVATSVPGRIAYATSEGAIITCDIDGANVDVLRASGEAVYAIAWSRDGARLAVTDESSLLVWDGTDGLRELAPSRGMPGLYSLAFTTDGERIATINIGDVWYLHVWDVASGARLFRDWIRGDLASLDIDRNDSIVAGTMNRLLVRLNAETFAAEEWMAGHQGAVWTVACSPIDDLFATSSTDGTIRLWRDGRTVGVVDIGHRSRLAFAPDASGLVYSDRGELRLWDFATPESMKLEGHSSYVYHVDFSPTGSFLLTSTHFVCEGFVWDPLTWRRISRVKTDEHPVMIGFDLDGLVRYNDSVFDPATGEPRGADGSLEWIRVSPTDVWSRNRRFRAGGTHDRGGNLVVRDASGRVHLELEGRYWGADFDPDSVLLAAANANGDVELWDLTSRSLVRKLKGHNIAYCADFSPDGTRLATGGNDNVVRIWDTSSWEQVFELRGHTSYVKALDFSPDGTQLASASGDFTVRIWDTVTRAERLRQARSRDGAE
jgi:WD40 repeat protein/tRNA A-37 threonylcarbamoyl transferase component Bud32